MPKHIIHRDEWDEFVVRLEREDDERVVAAYPLSEDQYEVLTVERHPRIEQREAGWK